MPSPADDLRIGRATVTVAQVWWSAFAVFVVLGAVWAFASPVMASPDETAHATKAAALVRGQVLGTERVVAERDPQLLNGVFTTYEVPAGYSALGSLPACYAFYPKIAANCAPAPSVESGAPAPAETYVGRYPPTYYALVGWPSALFVPSTGLPLMRLVSAVLSAAMLATAAAAIVDLRGARRMTVVGFVLAVPPAVLFIGSSINPSALEITAGIAVWLSGLALISATGPPTRSLVLRAALSIALFALTRPVSPVFLVVIVVLLWLVAGSRARARALWDDRFTRRTGLALVLVGALASAYLLVSKAFNGQQGFPLPDKSKADIARLSLEELPWRMRQLVGVFGWLDTPMSPPLILSWLAIAGVLVVAALVVGTGRQRIGVLGTAAALVIIPLGAEVAGAQSIGTVWQGRYSLPIAVGLPLVAGYVLDRSGRVPVPLARVASLVVAVFVAAVQLLGIATSVRRYATGADHPLLAYLDTNVWQPAGGAWPYTLVAAAAVVLYAAWVVWLAGAVAHEDPGAATGEPAAGSLATA